MYTMIVLFGTSSLFVSVVKLLTELGILSTGNVPDLIYKTSFWLIGMFMTICETTVASDKEFAVEFHAL